MGNLQGRVKMVTVRSFSTRYLIVTAVIVVVSSCSFSSSFLHVTTTTTTTTTTAAAAAAAAQTFDKAHIMICMAMNEHFFKK